MEKETIKFGVESILHMIRHFEKITSNDLSNMLYAGYTQVQIDNELKIFEEKNNERVAKGLPPLKRLPIIKKKAASSFTLIRILFITLIKFIDRGRQI